MNQQQHSHAFGSDNWAGVHPEILNALVAANVGHTPAYGGDPWTASFQELAQQLFGAEAEAFPVFNGTGANVLALQAALPRWGAVICARTAHINTDETGAPEKTGGLKLLSVDTPDGKLTPELVAREAWGFGNEHRAQPLAVSISQVTELGTCYTPDEIRALAEQAHAHNMLLHIDGSRLGNAAAYLGCSLAEISSDAGADLLSLGGTKNGLMGAEAVIVLRPGSTTGMPFLRKINLQLASKMRFVSAQLLALYEGDLWLRSAGHANAMAARLGAGLEELAASGRVPGIRIAHPVQSNGVFAVLPPEVAARARASFAFADWPQGDNMRRLMCAFDTTVEDVDALVTAIAG
ncbi:low specificity L-threonine aldolase [Leucobacter insecticola]|uniref:Low specificity L-threonine aldolase n=1 Tax=Leucobacter insecticola TaxID=2714934 RepID=A0A6G8FH60_9MICO|nr:low specificity L-threonine aldolase [Leucobacter insecticola]QIM15695.1 low specificity L-threonine aldolase [Leucobacter insecticola]